MSEERTLRRRISIAIGRDDVLRLAERLDRLETAVSEERTFVPALTAQVARLESELLPVLERTEEDQG